MPDDQKKFDFSDDELLAALKEVFLKDIASMNQPKAARDMLRAYEKSYLVASEFREANPGLASQFDELMVQIRFVAMPLLRDNEVVDLLKEHFTEGVKLGIDMADQFKWKCMGLATFEDRDNLQRHVYDAMQLNESPLVEKSLISSKTGTKLHKVKEFLQDYVKALGVDRVDGIQREQFLVHAYNIEHLEEDQKRAIKELFDLWEFLKIPAEEWAAQEEEVIVEDETGKTYLVRGNIIEGATASSELRQYISKILGNGESSSFDNQKMKSVSRAVALETLQKRWADFTSSELFREIEKKRRAQGAAVGSNFESAKEKVKMAMYDAINAGNAVDFIAWIAKIAESGTLRKTFHTDQRFSAFWQKHLERHWEDLKPKIIKTLKRECTLEEAQIEFIKDPAAPAHVILFLSEVLTKKMKLSEEESAMVGVYVSNIARAVGEGEYAAFAYGDVKDGMFKWNS